MSRPWLVIAAALVFGLWLASYRAVGEESSGAEPPLPAGEAGMEPVLLAQVDPDADAPALVLPGLGIERGNCVINGEVSDATTLEPIEGVFVDVVGAGRTVQTDAQGAFRIIGLPVGTYTLEASQLGYQTGTTVVTVIEAQPSVARFGLRARPVDDAEAVYTLEEETVVGEYQGDSPADLFLDLAVTPTLSSGLSSEDFTKAAVSDAGEAVEKISGANVVDGKYAVVRGLADRYITTTLNGASISSAVPSRKAVRLDLFPTSTLSGINVEKIHSPHLSGDFGGAAIDIRTKVFPTEPVADIKFKQEFNPELPGSMMLSADHDLEYFGDLGEDINQSLITGPDQRLITQPAAQAVDAWSILHANRTLRPVPHETEDKQSFSATLGDTIDLADGIKLGFLVAGGAGGEDNYNQSGMLRRDGRFWDQEEYQRQREWNLYAASGLQLGEFNEIRALYFRKNIAQQNVTIGRNIDDGGNNGWYGNTDAFEATAKRYGAAADVLGNFYENDPVEQDLELVQFSGRHQLGKRGPTLNWSATDSNAIEDRPNYSIFRTTTLDFTATEQFAEFNAGKNQGFYDRVNAFTPGADRQFSSVQEASDYFLSKGIFGPVVNPVILNNLLTQLQKSYVPVNEALGQIETVALNQFFSDQRKGPGALTQRTVQSTVEQGEDRNFSLDVPFYFDEDSEERGLSLGFGMSDVEKQRKTRVAIYNLVMEDTSASGGFQGGLPINQLYAVGGLGELLAANPELLQSYFTGNPLTGPYYQDDSLGQFTTLGGRFLINNVDATHTIESHFFSADVFAGDSFVRGGARFESEARRARIVAPRPSLTDLQNKFGTADGNPAAQSEDEMLPSFSAGTSLLDGNLKLLGAWSRTTARPTFYEWVPNETIDLSTGAIRYGNPELSNAEIENLDFSAEMRLGDDASLRLSCFEKTIKDPIIELFEDSYNIKFYNGDVGKLRGAELELELGNVGPFSLVSNLTYIDAELAYTVDNGGTPETTTSSFPYQPEWIFNANLGYENDEWDFGVNLVYNFVGENSTVIRKVKGDPSLVLGAMHSLDLVVRKGFGGDDDGGDWQVGCGIKNLYATDKEYTWDGGSAAVNGKTRNAVSADRTYFVEVKCAF